MIKTVEEVRRELFEAWFTKNYTAHKLSHRQTNCGILTNGYADSRVDLCWQGFNAALDAVEIELPHERSLSASDDPWSVREWCIWAIEQTGLGLKVKP